jgi:hypothetical protein
MQGNKEVKKEKEKAQLPWVEKYRPEKYVAVQVDPPCVAAHASSSSTPLTLRSIRTDSKTWSHKTTLFPF